MRLYAENTQNYIQSLAVSIQKDPASLDIWRCLHIQCRQDYTINAYYLQQIKEANKSVDCDIVICPDKDILLISSELSEGDLNNLAGAIVNGAFDPILECQPELVLYDLFRDWRTIRSVLLSKTDIAKPALPDAPASAHNEVDFGDVGALQEIFDAARKLRKARHPQYVMVVEDDPLTRRVVASAFKENYAIISATDAHEAIANYLLYAPDIVFLDIGLPDADGFTVLQQILGNDPDAYIVMFSGSSYLDNVTKALSSGAAGFVSKPFKKERMHHYIEDSLMHHAKNFVQG